MSPDLDELVRAAREAADPGDAAVARATRDRVLATLRPRPSARRRLSGLAAAIAASVMGATAFAWYARPTPTPMRHVDAVGRVTALVEPVRPHAGPATTPPAAPPAAIAPAESAPPKPVRPPAPVVAPPHRARPAPAPPPAPAPADREVAAYAVAHRLHFQLHDHAGAARAWDAYLAAWPDGQLAPEARFNRAVCLVRLERWRDADAALRALAEDPATARRADVDRLRAIVDSRLP